MRADDKGRFSVDGLQAGSWLLAAMHPRIDLLGIEQLARAVSITRVPRREVMPARPDGAFTVCGLPPGGTVRVRGFSGRDSTGIVELVVPEHGIARQDLAVGPVTHAVVDSQLVRRGSGTLRGRVTGPGGAPLPNVAVVVWGAESPARSDSAGYWQLRQLPTGTHTVETRALG